MKYKYVHKYLKHGDTVSVELNRQAYVLLLDPTNFMKFKRGDSSYRYHGGLAKSSPYKIAVPSTGDWYVVFHLGEESGNLKYKIYFL